MAEVTANGVRLHVQRLSEGDPTVVFIHGMVMDNLSSFFYTLAHPVARRAGVVLYDLRGHGRSERPQAGYAIRDSVADLVSLLDALGIRDPVHLVGNSYGGTVALAAAIARPDRVAGLALIEAHFSVKGWGQQMAGSLELAGYTMREEEAQAWFKQRGRKVNRMARSADSLIHETSMVEDLRHSPPFRATDLRGIHCPTLGIYGEKSEMIDRAAGLRRLLPASDVRVIEGGTHSVLMENTPVVREILLRWLEHVASAAGARP